MTWLAATLLLLLAAPVVLWPLIRHWQPESRPASGSDPREARWRELEEIELDVAAGRLSEAEAAGRRRELP